MLPRAVQEGEGVDAHGAGVVDREVVRRASFVCVDSREELGLEAGDLLRPLETGLILPEAIYELGQVIAGQV